MPPASPLRVRPVGVALPACGVFVLESRHAPGFRMAPDRHDYLELFYVLGGRGRFAVAGRDDPCGPGDVVVVPPGAVHQITDAPGDPLSLYGIGAAAALARLDPGVSALPAGRLPAPALVSRQVRDALRQMLYEQTAARPGCGASVAGRALQLLGLLARAAARPDPAPPPPGGDSLEAVRRYADGLRERFFEPATLGAAAASLGLSRRRFTELFRAAAGTSWLDHLTGLRVEYAAALLRDTDRSVTAVAFESGFEDLSSFYRAFKRRLGRPPREWRDASRGDAGGR